MWGSLGGTKKQRKRVTRPYEEESKTGVGNVGLTEPQILVQDSSTERSAAHGGNLTIAVPNSNVSGPLASALTPVSAMISPRGTGYSIIEKVFPSLTIDTSRETCPACNRQVTLEDVW